MGTLLRAAVTVGVVVVVSGMLDTHSERAPAVDQVGRTAAAVPDMLDTHSDLFDVSAPVGVILSGPVGRIVDESDRAVLREVFDVTVAAFASEDIAGSVSAVLGGTSLSGSVSDGAALVTTVAEGAAGTFTGEVSRPGAAPVTVTGPDETKG